MPADERIADGLHGVRIHRATPKDWSAARSTRLRSLAADPRCFGGSLEMHLGLTESDWRDQLARDVWLLAMHERGTTPIGLVVFCPDDTCPDGAPQLGAMWVESTWRRRGVAAALEAAVEAEARRVAAVSIGLWVNAGNQRALGVYRRLGYLPTGATKAAPRDRTVLMRRMLKTLVASS